MSIFQCLATIVENEEIIQNHRVIVCRAPELARAALPGQFVNVLASETYNSILRKPFSIYKADVISGEISILFQVGGATTLGMSRKLPGDTLDLVGPLGGKVFAADPHQEVTHVLIGGGYGIPPLVFLAERIRELSADARIMAIVGARRKDLLLCEPELLSLGADVKVATEDGSHGSQGKVTDVLSGLPPNDIAVYCCGPTRMMRAVGDYCLSSGIPCQLSLEVPMPCGVGVCMGCVVDLTGGSRVRACTDGPVFQAAEVLWT